MSDMNSQSEAKPLPVAEDPAWREEGRLLFAGSCEFVAGAASLDALPDGYLPEVAFAGRSNVGKSSLLNALTGRKALARTSQTPGRTQQINFFDLADRLMLVDLPGYGYAKASKAKVGSWTRLVEDYLRGRPNLVRVLLLIDARHGIKPNDREIMELLDRSATSYQIVLTKADKSTDNKLQQLDRDISAGFPNHPAAFPDIHPTSSQKGTGIEGLRAILAALAADHGNR